MTTRRTLVAAALLAFPRPAATRADAATPAADGDAGIVGIARRAFRRPGDDGFGIDADAFLFASPPDADAAFPQVFDMLVGMLGDGEDAPAPAFGDGARARTIAVAGDGGPGATIGAVGVRSGALVVVVIATATAADDDPLPTAIGTAERARDRVAAATPTPGTDPFALLPTQADVPTGLVLVDEAVIRFDDQATPAATPSS